MNYNRDRSEIESVVRRYARACEKGDFAGIRVTATDSLAGKHGIFARAALFVAKLFGYTIKVEEIRIEQINGDHAYVDCTFRTNNQRRYERMVCVRTRDGWRVDGKFE